MKNRITRFYDNLHVHAKELYVKFMSGKKKKKKVLKDTFLVIKNEKQPLTMSLHMLSITRVTMLK